MGKDRLARKEITERDIASANAENQELHPRGETLPEDQRIYRAKVFSCSGTPLNKLN